MHGYLAIHDIAIGCVLRQIKRKGKSNLLSEQEVSIRLKTYDNVLRSSLGYLKTQAITCSLSLCTQFIEWTPLNICLKSIVRINCKVVVLFGIIPYCIRHSKSHQRQSNSRWFRRQPNRNYDPMTFFFPDESILVIEPEEMSTKLEILFCRCKYSW